MIGHLRGKVLLKTPGEVIVEAAGVGYEVTVPISTYAALPDEGSEVTLRIYTHVREDALALFGFITREEKIVFERLLSVSGIGPKLAVTVLSGLATAELIAAIRSGDLVRLVRIPGVGKKTAERIVLELRDKLTGVAEPAASMVPDATPKLSGLEQDVLSALINLGCTRVAAEEAIRRTKEQGAPEGFEPFFRSALALVR